MRRKFNRAFLVSLCCYHTRQYLFDYLRSGSSGDPLTMKKFKFPVYMAGNVQPGSKAVVAAQGNTLDRGAYRLYADFGQVGRQPIVEPRRGNI